MKKLLSAILFLLFLAPLYAEDTLYQQIGPFNGLNNSDNPLIIGTGQAQDLLNVDITPGGKSVKKRKGYAQAFQLTNSSMTGHGVHYFYDSDGLDIALFFNDSYGYGSKSGAQPTTLFSTGPVSATYQCVDSQGYAYCVNSSRSWILKTNGVTISFVTPISTGTTIVVTPTRLAMAGFSDYPNRIDFSQANDFTNWTPGGYSYSPVNFTVTAPGSKITHLVYAHERVYWFKQTSFGYIMDGPTLSDWTMRTVSNDIGSNDNTSVYKDGVLYFRGSDSSVYSYDGANLSDLTREIGTTIGGIQSKSANLWIQTTQADFEAGISSADLSTSINPGSLQAKTTYYITTTSGSFTGWTIDNAVYGDTITVPGKVQTTFPDEFNYLRTGMDGTKLVWSTATTSPGNVTVSGGTLTLNTGAGIATIRTVNKLRNTAPGTTYYMRVNYLPGDTRFILSTATTLSTTVSAADFATYFDVATATNGTVGFGWYSSLSYNTGSTACLSTNTSSLLVEEAFTVPNDVYVFISTTYYSVTIGTTEVASAEHTCTAVEPYAQLRSQSAGSVRFESFGMAPTSFSIVSAALDTGIVYPKYSTFTATLDGITGGYGSIATESKSSANGTTFGAGSQASTGSVIVSAPNRYLLFSSTFNQTLATGTVGTNYHFSAGSSGTFVSQIGTATARTAWDAMVMNTITQDGSMTFFTRSSGTLFSRDAQDLTWTATPINSIPTIISTNPYVQLKAMLTANSTGAVRLDDFKFNWYEGAAEDKSYAAYHDDAIWWAVTSGTGVTTNNKILRYDLINPYTWTIYDIPTNGMYVRNQYLYFVGSSTGVVYKYGHTDNDNGSAINAYWKSKDFIGISPFQDNEYTRLSLSAAMVANSSMTIVYTIDGSSNTAYTMPLKIGNATFTKFNKNLPQGRTGTFFNLQFGNNASDQSFEIFSAQYGYRPKPWVVTVP